MAQELMIPTELEISDKQLISQARNFTVANNLDLTEAKEISKEIRKRRKTRQADLEIVVSSFHKAWKNARARVDTLLDQFDEGDTPINAEILRFEREEEQKRRAEERRLQEEARKREEEERLALAAELEASGKKEEAEAVIEAPIETPTVVLPKTTQKIAGERETTYYFFEVINAALVPHEFCSPDPAKIGAYVRANKALAKIPGVRTWPETKKSYVS